MQAAFLLLGSLLCVSSSFIQRTNEFGVCTFKIMVPFAVLVNLVASLVCLLFGRSLAKYVALLVYIVLD